MKQIICLSDRPWTTVPTRTPQLLTRLRDTQILYFEPPVRGGSAHLNRARRVRPNILAYTMPYVPDTDGFYGLRLLRSRRKTINYIYARMQHHGFQNPVLWVTHPRYSAVLDALPYRGLIYDCDAYHPESMGAQEGALAQAADVVFAASPGLADHLSPCNPNLALIPNGVNYPMFSRPDPDVPPCLAGLSGPILGWAGDMASDVDLEPVEYAASEHPEWTFVLSGNLKGSRRLFSLRQLPNVLLTGPCPLSELPDYLGRFDVCLSLLRCEEDTDVIPSRIFEYLSTGKPIVSMLYEDQVEEFPDVVYGAHTPQQFSALCARALEESPGWVSTRRQEYGRAAAWTERAAEVKRILESIGLY